MDKLIAVLVIGVLFLLVFAGITALSLFIIKFSWSIFMVPIFHLPELTWTQAFGLSLIIGALKSSSVKIKK